MTDAASGAQSIFGCAEETVYGTEVTPDRFIPFLPGESLHHEVLTQVSQAIRGGLNSFQLASLSRQTGRQGAGDVSFEVYTNGFGRLFKHILGAAPTITSLTGSAKRQRFTIADPSGQFMTLQKQLVDPAGNAIGTFTHRGAVIVAAEFSISVNGYLQLKLTFDSMEEVSTTAAATATFGTTKPLSFQEGLVKVAGSTIALVEDFRLTFNRSRNVSRFYIGSGGTKAKPLPNAYPTAQGVMNVEFADLTLYNLFKNHTTASVELKFSGDVIAGGTDQEGIDLTLPACIFTGGTPPVQSLDVVKLTAAFDGWAPASGAACTLDYITTDTAA